MLQLALTLLILALIAAVLGFGGLAGSFVEIAKILFFVFIVLFLISAVVSALRGRTPVLLANVVFGAPGIAWSRFRAGDGANQPGLSHGEREPV